MANISVTFPEACVKTVNTAGQINASDTMHVSAFRVSDHIFEIYHCNG